VRKEHLSIIATGHRPDLFLHCHGESVDRSRGDTPLLPGDVQDRPLDLGNVVGHAQCIAPSKSGTIQGTSNHAFPCPIVPHGAAIPLCSTTFLGLVSALVRCVGRPPSRPLQQRPDRLR
jgi:hypothetical protein